jgi:glycosyltransferase involved in cell wall biosynthesis
VTTTPFGPIWSSAWEWDATSEPIEPARASTGERFQLARLLIRRSGTPLGFVQVPLRDGRVDPIDVQAEAERQLGVLKPPEPAPASVPFADELVSVAVCTRGRAQHLRRCLHSLIELQRAELEILIVDNAPPDGATQEVVAEFAALDARIRYILEPRPGLSCARNRALREARGEFLAYTDDDARVDPDWLDGVLRGFGRRPDTECVTGLVASSSLETPAERFFDERVSWSSGCEPQLYDATPRGADSKLHPFAAGVFGTGANMSFRTDFLRRLGGFDESLGAGTATGGGEDLDIFVRVIRSGGALAYEPSALVWHDHRVELHDLEKQMYAYGKGLAAYLCKHLFSRRSGPAMAVRLLRGAVHFAQLSRRSQSAGSDAGLGRKLLYAELRGLAAGGPAYLAARRAQTREHIASVSP